MKHVFVAGHNGMVGSAIVRILRQQSDVKLITADRSQLDLCNQADVLQFIQSNEIDEIYLAAAKVGGIHSNNTYPAEFIYQNMMIEANVIHAAHLCNIQKLLFLGSSCIYPKESAQPIVEEALLTGPLESTNEPYAIAKIAGIKLCESYNRQYGRDYRSIMPTNLYGRNDNYHPENSHVIPALISKFHQAKINCDEVVTVWGSGNAMREFLYVDDMAAAALFVMDLDVKKYHSVTKPMCAHINVGSGTDYTIAEIATIIARVVGYPGRIEFDSSKPEGPKRKLVDSSILDGLGWSAKVDFIDGIEMAYKWFLQR